MSEKDKVKRRIEGSQTIGKVRLMRFRLGASEKNTNIGGSNITPIELYNILCCWTKRFTVFVSVKEKIIH